ncbi:recombinase zinc beta ribbon domain-containing protein [Arcanobacterium phocae]|uniref:recombinase zinc beta ribbon domain-containing protein n=1 Tax=Arcanobacterium phocae TaxID=131112 RepID=UPI00344CAEA6
MHVFSDTQVECLDGNTILLSDARRSGKGTSSTRPFANRIKCADCGGWFGRTVWHSTSKYLHYLWRCNNK